MNREFLFPNSHSMRIPLLGERSLAEGSSPGVSPGRGLQGSDLKSDHSPSVYEPRPDGDAVKQNRCGEAIALGRGCSCGFPAGFISPVGFPSVRVPLRLSPTRGRTA